MSSGRLLNCGVELRRLREAHGLSQAKFAEKINFSRSYVCRVEQGTKPLTAAMAAACDQELGSDLGALVEDRPNRTARQGGLPPATARFTGRADELGRIVSALCAVEGSSPGVVVLCSVTGMGGIGKTALAVRAAHLVKGDFPDGCAFIDLHGFDGHTAVDPADALYRLLLRLGIQHGDIPAHVEDRSALFRMRLEGKKFLLVLDNARDVEQVAPLIPSAGCSTLITSRDTLAAMDDAVRVPLGPLSASDSVDLLRMLFPDAFTDEDLGRIADWSGHLPLALRISSATFAGIGAEELSTRLSDVADRLGDFEQGGRSLTEVFAQSTAYLAPDLWHTFLLLGLHPGAEFELQAAAALIGERTATTRRRLRSLCELSLLTSLGRERYKFHDLLRLFAAERAQTDMNAADRLAALTRVIDYYLRSIVAADQLLNPGRYLHDLPAGAPVIPQAPKDYGEALAWAIAEQDNLVGACRTAYSHGLDDRCWILAHVLRGYFFLAKPWPQWIETHELAAKAAQRAADHEAEAVALNNLGLAHMEQGDHETAGTLYRRAGELFAEIGDAYGVHTSHAHHAWVHYARGDHEEALRESLEALEFRRINGSARLMAILLRDIALIEIALGRYESAVRRLNEASPIFAEVGSRIDRAMAFNCLGEAYLHLGRVADAGQVLRDAVDASRVSGSSYERARALENLGHVACADSSYDQARSMWARALDLYGGLRDTNAEQRVRRNIASLRSPDVDAARREGRSGAGTV